MFKFNYLFLIFISGIGVSNASIVNPDSVVNLFGTTNAANGGALSGVVRNDNLIPYTVSDGLGNYMGGNIQNRVVELNSDSTLVFSPRIRDIVDLARAFEFSIIKSFQLTGFAGVPTDIEYRTDGSGDDGPDTVSRSSDGDTLTFRFDAPELNLTKESHFVSINTDATRFNLSGTLTIFGQRTAGQTTIDSITITGIASPVPVPAAVLLFGPGLAVLSLIRRFRARDIISS
jgi:hypothetical protein